MKMKPFRKFEVRWNEPVGLTECPYMFRWCFIFWQYGIRIHKWISSDDLRYPHDHAFWMLIIILKGSYTDIAKDGTIDVLSAGSIRFRKAEHAHMVKVGINGCISLLITGKPIRDWGFWIPGRKTIMRPLRYFSRYGHHPCE